MRGCQSVGGSEMPILIKNRVCSDMLWMYRGNGLFQLCNCSYIYTHTHKIDVIYFE